MRFEAFSEGKDLDHPEANEDQFLFVPGCGFAVIDGVTDISGRVVDGMRTGRLASGIVQRATIGFLCDAGASDARPEALIEHVSAALRACYVRLGIVDEVTAHPARRFGATLTLAIDRGDSFRFILIGDSGLRLNGAETVVIGEGLDHVTATLRQEAFRLVAEAGGDLAAQRAVGRACSFYGASALHADMQPWLDDASLESLHGRSLASCKARFPAAPEADIALLLDRGISGQTQFQNNTLSPFSYAVFDGFDIPMKLVGVIDRPKIALTSIELFSDGYFKSGATPDVAAWEVAFEDVERSDAEKIGPYMSVKGSYGRMRTDDRTIVIARL